MATKEVELTEGVLCRDSKQRGGHIAFCRGIKPRQIDFTGGWADCEDSDAHDWRSWGADEFDRIYGLKQAPGYGKKMLVDIEL